MNSMEIKDAIHKMEGIKKGYQKLLDEKVQEGMVVGSDVTGTWSSDTPLTDVYQTYVEVCQVAIIALKKMEADDCYMAPARREASSGRTDRGCQHFWPYKAYHL